MMCRVWRDFVSRIPSYLLSTRLSFFFTEATFLPWFQQCWPGSIASLLPLRTRADITNKTSATMLLFSFPHPGGHGVARGPVAAGAL